MQRTVPSLFSLKHFKAKEYRNLAMYLLSIITIDQFSDTNCWHFVAIFVHIIRLISMPLLNETQLQTADKLINIFSSRLECYLGLASYTFNIHMLRHITSQIRQFGTISFTNMAVFESWGGWLKQVNTGSVISILNIVSRRYLSYKNQEIVNVSSNVDICVQGKLQPLTQNGIYLIKYSLTHYNKLLNKIFLN